MDIKPTPRNEMRPIGYSGQDFSDYRLSPFSQRHYYDGVLVDGYGKSTILDGNLSKRIAEQTNELGIQIDGTEGAPTVEQEETISPVSIL